MLYREYGIIEQLKKIPYGTLLKIMWLDAATVRGAKITKLPLPNYCVETRRTTIGCYICLQQGRAQKAWHIVLEMDNTEGNGSMIRSIPVCLIYRVVAPVKVAEETEVEFEDKRDLLVNHEKSEITLPDGSTKFLD